LTSLGCGVALLADRVQVAVPERVAPASASRIGHDPLVTPRTALGNRAVFVSPRIGEPNAKRFQGGDEHANISRFLFGLVATTANAENCQIIGNRNTYCDNGLSSQRIGNTTYWNDGRLSQHIGNHTYNSDGSSIT
jgi:hypothetical protein